MTDSRGREKKLEVHSLAGSSDRDLGPGSIAGFHRIVVMAIDKIIDLIGGDELLPIRALIHAESVRVFGRDVGHKNLMRCRRGAELRLHPLGIRLCSGTFPVVIIKKDELSIHKLKGEFTSTKHLIKDDLTVREKIVVSETDQVGGVQFIKDSSGSVVLIDETQIRDITGDDHKAVGPVLVYLFNQILKIIVVVMTVRQDGNLKISWSCEFDLFNAVEIDFIQAKSGIVGDVGREVKLTTGEK
jgi:hypothetical protein